MRIDEVVDGLLDPNAEEIIGEEIPTSNVEEELDAEEARTRMAPRCRARACCSSSGRAGALRHHRPALRQDDEGAGQMARAASPT